MNISKTLVDLSEKPAISVAEVENSTLLVEHLVIILQLLIISRP